MTRRLGAGTAILYAVVLAFLAIFVAYPMARVFLTPSPADWTRLFASPRWAAALRGSLVMTVLSTVSSVALGYAYAYAVVRGGIPLARQLAAVPILFLATPPFVGGLAFTFLLGRRGIVTSGLLGLDVSIYGWKGLWLAQTLSFFPIAYLILASALRGLGPSVELAARGLGAGRARAFRTVVLPLTRPSIVSASLFVGLSALSDFANPMLVGGRFRVLATEVYAQIAGWASAGAGAAAGLTLLVPAAGLFALQRAASRGDWRRYAASGGRDSAPRWPESSPAAKAILFALCALVALYVLANYSVILYGALARAWGADHRPTGAHFRAIALYGRELRDSLAFAAAAAAIGTALSASAAYLSRRCGVPLGGAIEAAAAIPAAVPHTLLGLAFAISFNARPLPLAGGSAIVVLAMAVCYFPFGYRIAAASMGRLKESLDESAASLGAGRLRTLVEIILPLIGRSLASAFSFSFILSMGTMSAVIFLVSFRTPLASVSILNLAEQGSWGDAAALAAALTAVAMAGLALARLAAGRFALAEASS
jgi:iron(III) transport system permease protein